MPLLSPPSRPAATFSSFTFSATECGAPGATASGYMSAMAAIPRGDQRPLLFSPLRSFNMVEVLDR